MAEPTEEERAELRKLAVAATPGPWSQGPGSESRSFVYNTTGMRRQVARTLKLGDNHDARFIAAANPAVVLSLLDALDSRDRALAEIKAALRRFVPSKLDSTRCRNCEEPRHEHYSGPFAEPDTLYCSKYFVPMRPTEGQSR